MNQNVMPLYRYVANKGACDDGLEWLAHRATIQSAYRYVANEWLAWTIASTETHLHHLASLGLALFENHEHGAGKEYQYAFDQMRLFVADKADMLTIPWMVTDVEGEVYNNFTREAANWLLEVFHDWHMERYRQVANDFNQVALYLSRHNRARVGRILRHHYPLERLIALLKEDDTHV